MKNLQVWRHRFKIPKEIRRQANLLNDLDELKQSRFEGVPTVRTWSGLDVVATDGYCAWHDDSHLLQSWSCLLIIRNDTNSWVEVEGCPVNLDQPVGRLVLFNLNVMHRLNCGGGTRGKPGVWCCLAWDSREPLTKEEWIAKITASLERADEMSTESRRRIRKLKFA